MKSLIGKKLGMTQIFDEEGRRVPVTVIEAGACSVVQRKTAATDGYEAIQLGFGAQKPERVAKPLAGHFKKAGVGTMRELREVRVDADDAAKASIAYHLEPSLAREAFAGSFEYVISERLGDDPLRPITRNLATHFQPPLPGSNPTDGYLYTTMTSLDVATAKSGTLQQLGYNIEALEMWPNNLDLEIYLGYVKKLWWNQ